MLKTTYPNLIVRTLFHSIFCGNLKRFILVFCLFTSISLFAAKPVTVIVSLRPPYTPFLNEYGSLGADQLQVSIIVNDSRMINYPAKLQMLIERVGSGVVMRTGDYASIAPIMLTGNVTEFFNGFDLSEHFLYENLVFVGMDGSQYIRTGRIPNDRYRIGFRIVDSRRPEVVLSNTSYSQPGWFLLNDPPQINIPINQSVVRVNEVQNVKFNWFPRHLGSLNKSFSSLFQLEVFAIRVPGMNPNQLASSMSPNFTDVTSLTSYFLTSDKYVLEPGVEYAFRVKAMSGSGDELTLFQNQGYSDVHSFTYGTVCHAPENNIAEPLDRDKVLIKWDNAPSHTSFEVRFRRAGHSEDKWHQRESVTENVEIGNILSSGVSYEYQIKGICLNVASDYSPLSTFTLPEPVETDFDCGAEDSVIAVTNRVPKQSLRAGDKVHYGKFPIKLTEVSGSNGIFTGKGRMRVPFLAYASVNMQFNGIKVNELNEVYEGEVVSIYNPDSKFLIKHEVSDRVENKVSGEEEVAITLDYVVGDASSLEVTVSENSVTVRSSQGSTATHSITTPTDSITISDSEGNLYVVDLEKEEVSKVAISVDNNVVVEGDSGDNANDGKPEETEFIAHHDKLYGFDNTKEGEVWQSLEVAKNDKIIYNIKPDSTYNNVYFHGGSQLVSVTPKRAESVTQELALASSGIAGVSEVVVSVDSINGEVINNLKVQVYAKKRLDLMIVVLHEENDDVQEVAVGNKVKPNTICVSIGGNNFRDTRPNWVGGNPNMDGDDEIDGDGNITVGANGICETEAVSQPLKTKSIDLFKLEDMLNNKVYNQGVLEWNVKEIIDLNVNWDLNQNQSFEILDYNREYELVIGKEFLALDSVLKVDNGLFNRYKESYFMIMTDYSEPIIQNYQFIDPYGIHIKSYPRYAFTFSDKSINPYLTIAHELGHSAFGFLDNTYKARQYLNLMNHVTRNDYTKRVWLLKEQWDQIHDIKQKINK